MVNFNYDLVELRFNELEDIYIVEIVYDEEEYYRISCIADMKNKLVTINTNLVLEPGELSYFEISDDSDDEAMKQFVGVAKVVFNNLFIKELFDEDEDFDIKLNCIDFADTLQLRSNFIKTLREVDEGGVEIPDHIFDKYNQLMFSIDSTFLSVEILTKLLLENSEEQIIN